VITLVSRKRAKATRTLFLPIASLKAPFVVTRQVKDDTFHGPELMWQVATEILIGQTAAHLQRQGPRFNSKQQFL